MPPVLRASEGSLSRCNDNLVLLYTVRYPIAQPMGKLTASGDGCEVIS